MTKPKKLKNMRALEKFAKEDKRRSAFLEKEHSMSDVREYLEWREEALAHLSTLEAKIKDV